MAWEESKEAVIKLENLLKCFHCHRVMDEPQTLGACDHHLCKACVSAVFRRSSCQCPVCGLPAWVKDLKSSRQMEMLIKLVSSLKTLLIEPTELPRSQTIAVMHSQQSTSPNVLTTNDRSFPSSTLCNDSSSNLIVRKISGDVFKKPELIREIRLNTHVLRSGKAACPSDSQIQTSSKSHLPAVSLSQCSYPTTVYSPLLTSYKTCKPQQSAHLLTTVSSNYSNNKFRGKRNSATVTMKQQTQCKKQRILQGTTANISPMSVKFPFSPLVTKTRSYSKLDKSGKLLRLQQSSVPGQSIKEQLTLSDFLVTSSCSEDVNSVPVKREKNSPPSTSTLTRHVRTMRRNVRGETPLHIASIKGDAVEVCALLNQGADPNVKDNAGWTPLHEACNHGHISIVTQLVNHNAMINAPGFDNDTPLHDAVANGYIDIAKLLLERGASVTIRNCQGSTPMDLARSDSMMKLLAQHSGLQVSPDAILNSHASPQVNGSASHVANHHNFVLLCTGLKGYQKKQVQDAASVLGASMVTSFSCSGVIDSLNNQSWMDEVKYEVAGITMGDSNLISDAPRKGRENAAKKLPRLFENYEFFLSDTFVPPQASKTDMINLIQLAGGVVLLEDPRISSVTTLKDEWWSTFIIYDPSCQKQDIKSMFSSCKHEMPGRGKAKASKSGTRRHYKVKQQKKRFIRSKDPILSVFMWGIQHSINELTTSLEPSLLLPEDFKAFSKIRVENQYYNKENLPGHFKFKEYCPRVFHDLRKRFGFDDVEYMNSLISQPPEPADSPGRSGAKFFVSHDKKLVIKSITTEEVALLHIILQAYHAHLVTTEGQTLLPQYLGTYRLTVNNAETYWIVMRSIFSSSIKMHRKFDLKGSTVDRQASSKEKTKLNPTLKDLDFTEMEEKILVGGEAKRVLLNTVEADVMFLQKLNLMDYSLLVGIHDCTVNLDSDQEDHHSLEEDGDGYVSSDDLGDLPCSPHSPGPSTIESGTEGRNLTPSEVLVLPSPESGTEHLSPQLSSGDEGHEQREESSTAQSPEISPVTGDQGTSACATEEMRLNHPVVVRGEKAVEASLLEGNSIVVDKDVDVFAVASEKGTKPLLYYLGIIDVLTNYGARKRAAHAAKTMKHGAGAEISTVRPDQYARRFLDFLSKVIQ